VFDDELLPPPLPQATRPTVTTAATPTTAIRSALAACCLLCLRTGGASHRRPLLDPGPRQSNSDTSLRPIPGEDPHAST
jgi:hypothetical protein